MITDAAGHATASAPVGTPPAAPPATAPETPGRAARRVAMNSLFPFAAGFGARGLSMLLAAVMARRLGPSGSGAYNFTVSLWLYASILGDFGLGTWLTREVARAPADAEHLVKTTLGLRLALSAVAALLLVGVAAVYAQYGADPRIVATAALLGLGLLPGAFAAAGTALFNAHERMLFPAAVQLLSACLTAGGGGAALLLGFDYVALAWVSLAVNVVTAALFSVACARRYFRLGVSLRRAESRRLAHDALPLMLNSLLNNVFFRIDVPILQSQGSRVVGYYTNAYKVIDAAGTVPSSFVLALFPLLSRRAAAQAPAGEGAAGGDGAVDGLGRVYHLALKLLVAAALPLALLVTFLAPEIIVWFLGPAFVPHSVTALRILIWFLPLSFVNGLTQYVLIAAGLQRRITVAFGVTAVFNLAANLVFIPLFSYRAAAAITIASEAVLLVPFLLALRQRTPLRPALLATLRPLPAAAGMGVILFGLGEWSRPLAAALGCLAYPALLLGTIAFDAAERRALAGLLPVRDRPRHAP